MQNIEIKTPLPDRESMEHRLVKIGAERIWTREQRDTFFRVPSGYLKLRQADGAEAELIAYRREAGTHPRPSDYDLCPVVEPETLVRALTRSLGVLGVVEKQRTLYRWQHTRIHLDEVRDLGSFLELESVAREITVPEARDEAEAVITALELDRSRFLDRPYLELMLARTDGAGVRVTSRSDGPSVERFEQAPVEGS